MQKNKRNGLTDNAFEVLCSIVTAPKKRWYQMKF